MNVVDLNLRVRELQMENQRLRNTLNTNRNSQSHRSNMIDFQTKYKKALKQIYEVIQANKQLKEELDKLKTSRNKLDGSMADVRKEQIYKVYESVLNQKNQLQERTHTLEAEREMYHTQMEALEAEVNILKGEKMYLAQQKQAAQAKSLQGHSAGSKAQELHQLQMRFRQKQQQFHRTLQNYEQHHMTLSNQNKKNEERVEEMQQKLIQTDKNWRNRFQTKDIQFKEIRTSVRHEYQDQINSLRKEINSLKVLNTELMTKLQTVDMDGRKDEDMTEYEVQMLSSIKQLRLQMEPLRKQIIELQEQNSFEKQQAERERTQLQLKLYEYESNIQHYSMQLKNQQEKINKLNQTIKKHSDNQILVKKLEEENRILGGRVIVLESRDFAIQNTRQAGSRKLQENVLQFQTRVEMLLSQKENLANVKNVSIHQLVTLKAYIVQMDHKLKSAYNENQYATKKYKSYKQKYLTVVKEIKNHEILQNTLKSKIMGYDKLVQRLQSELEKNVNITEMEVIEMNSKTTHEQVQIQTFKKKYQSLKEKLILQQKYNKQELQTVKLNYQTKIVDFSIKAEQINGLRQSLSLYKQKNEELMNQMSQKENQMLEVRLSVGKQTVIKNDNELTVQNKNRELISSLQQAVHKQESHILKLQTEARNQQDASRKRILGLERQLQDINAQYNKLKLSSSTRHSSEKNSQQLSSQIKRLKNKISQLQNELIITRGRTADQSSKNSFELQFRISNLQIQRNQLANRLQTEISHKKRLQKQYNQAVTKSNQLEAQLTQTTLQNNRKLQQAKFELNQKHSIIQNLEQQVKRLKTQQRSNLESSTLLNTSVPQREDHSMHENKIRRLERELENLQADNQQLRKSANQSNSTTNSFNYQLQSLKHEKEQARLKIQRLEKELSSVKGSIQSQEEEKYELNRNLNSLKAQLSSTKLSHQDQLFQKDRVIAQLRSKVQHTESLAKNSHSLQTQLEHSLQQKERQLASLRSKLYSAQADLQQMNDTINKYNQQITSIKYANETSHSTYTQQIQQLLQEKSRTLKKYQQQIQNLNSQIEARNQEISLKAESLMRMQRELSEYKQFEQEIDRLKSSLIDRQTLISKNRFEISSYEEENQRAKKELSSLKEQLQRIRLQVLEKDDEISSLRLQISTVGNRVSNQVKNELMQELGEKESQVSRLSFQIQSLQNSYKNMQQELNETEARQRKAQQELMFTRSQLQRAEEQLSETSQKLMKRQSQVSQMNGQMNGLKFLQEQVSEKNLSINKLRGQLTSTRIQINHLTEQIEYKESTIIRQNNELKLSRQQIIERQQTISRKEIQLRNTLMEVQRLRSTLEQNQIETHQKDTNINRITTELNKLRNQHRELEEEIEERQQEWSNIQYELTQTKSQITLISDQLEGKDITITKLSNEAAFLKQQITRLNEQLVDKNHEINRVSQQVFVQKMEYTNRTSQQVQNLSNQIFSIKRQLQSTRHTIEDLQGQNRRLKIEVQGSRIKLNQQNNMYIYTQDDLSQLKQQNNRKYRQIMQLQFELNQNKSENQILRQRAQHTQAQLSNKNSQISLLTQKTEKLQLLLKQLEDQNQYNNEHLQSQVQQFIQTERRLRIQIQELQHANTQTFSTGNQSQNTDQLKFGLKLYTEETDRLKRIIEQLTQQVGGLRLKLSALTNQQDRIQQNLVTMVLSFAQVEALRQRMKNKEQEINEVRRSFIQAISSSSDVHSQAFKSSKLVNLAHQTQQQKGLTFEQAMSQNSASLINYKSQKGAKKVQVVKEIHQYEVRSEKGAENPFDQEIRQNQQNVETHSLDGQNQHEPSPYHIQQQNLYFSGQITDRQEQHQAVHQEDIQLPEPQSREESIQPHQTSHHLEELNQLREFEEEEQVIGTSQAQSIISRNQQNMITPQQSVTVTQTQVTIVSPPQQQVITSQQRGRTVNITYQGSSSQVQTVSSLDRTQAQQRISSSQFQAPSGTTYVRITSGQQRVSLPQNVVQTSAGVYIPQGMNIAPIRQGMSVNQSVLQSGNRVVMGNQVVGQHQGVIGSFAQNNPQNLRY